MFRIFHLFTKANDNYICYIRSYDELLQKIAFTEKYLILYNIYKQNSQNILLLNINL